MCPWSRLFPERHQLPPPCHRWYCASPSDRLGPPDSRDLRHCLIESSVLLRIWKVMINVYFRMKQKVVKNGSGGLCFDIYWDLDGSQRKELSCPLSYFHHFYSCFCNDVSAFFLFCPKQRLCKVFRASAMRFYFHVVHTSSVLLHTSSYFIFTSTYSA